MPDRKPKQEAESLRDFNNSDTYFYSLCRPIVARKKRVCLKCTEQFTSARGNRICGGCHSLVSSGARAEYAIPDSLIRVE